MQRLRLMLALVVALATLSLTTSAQKETRDIKGFTEVSFGVAGDLYVKVGPTFSVTLEGDADFLKKVVTELKGNKLVIKHEGSWNSGNNKVIAHITMPSVEGLSLSGSGKIIVESPLKGSALSLAISGSGRLIASDFTYEKMNCSISGSGSFEFNGTGMVTDASLAISGSGGFKAPGLELKAFEVRVSGSGSCDCYVTGMLTASISGSGDIIYAGNPKVDIRSSGSGKVRSK